MDAAALVRGPGAAARTGDVLASSQNSNPAAINAAAAAEPHLGLVLAAQRGDQKAFTALVEFYQQTVYGYLRARLFDSTDAEDLTQETFLRCYQGREKLARAEKPSL